MGGISITIGEHVFPSKKAARDFIGRIRGDYPDGVPVSPYHRDIIVALVRDYHSEAGRKLGCGVSHVTVSKVEGYSTRGFILHRTDGSSTDFSYYHCFETRRDDRDQKWALREAIRPQIEAFRRKAFSRGPVICPYRNILLTPSNCHVDHEAPRTFDYLYNSWLKEEGLTLLGIKVTPPADNQVKSQMIDPVQITLWDMYHAQHARLRVISREANLSDARKNIL